MASLRPLSDLCQSKVCSPNLLPSCFVKQHVYQICGHYIVDICMSCYSLSETQDPRVENREGDLNNLFDFIF